MPKTIFDVDPEPESVDGQKKVQRVACCGKETSLYEQDRMQFCLKCGHQYDLNGKDIGIYGTGCMTLEDYAARCSKRRNMKK
jgi:hypothetical protein